MMTEAEAKTKWCPMARMAMVQSATPARGRSSDMSFAIGSPSSFNRLTVSNQEGVTIPDASLCIGSACMAWRWIEKSPYRKRWYENLKPGAAEPPRPDNVAASWIWEAGDPHDEECSRPRWIEPESEALARATGYCGAFGRPE